MHGESGANVKIYRERHPWRTTCRYVRGMGDHAYTHPDIISVECTYVQCVRLRRLSRRAKNQVRGTWNSRDAMHLDTLSDSFLYFDCSYSTKSGCFVFTYGLSPLADMPCVWMFTMPELSHGYFVHLLCAAIDWYRRNTRATGIERKAAKRHRRIEVNENWPKTNRDVSVHDSAMPSLTNSINRTVLQTTHFS